MFIPVAAGGSHLRIFKEQCFPPSNDSELSRVEHGVLELKIAKAPFNTRELSSLFLDLNRVIQEERDFGAVSHQHYPWCGLRKESCLCLYSGAFFV